MKKTILGAALTAAVITVGVVTSASGESAYTTADDIYKGTGWAAQTKYGVYSIDPNETYVITYGSTTARTKLQPMMEKVVTQLQGLGLKVYNTTTVEAVSATACQPRNHITITLKYRPMGTAGNSQARPCSSTSDHSLFSGKVWIDSEYKQLGGAWNLSDKLWKNVFPHEFGHAFGLDHAPAPAQKNAAGDTPTMTSPNGGPNVSSKYGTLTAWDTAGIKQLMENHDG